MGNVLITWQTERLFQLLRPTKIKQTYRFVNRVGNVRTGIATTGYCNTNVNKALSYLYNMGTNTFFEIETKI